MAFFRNDAVNRVNLHYGVQALAQAGGGVFFLVFMLRSGVPAPMAFLAQAAIVGGRFLLRPLVLPLAKRFGLKPVMIAGALVIAVQYPLLSQVEGVGPILALLCLVSAVGDTLYWLAYNAYFAAIGDVEHRGHQVSAREALVALASIVAPLLGATALTLFGGGVMFTGVGLIQALAVLPLLGAPNVTVAASAPGALRAARPGVALSAADGWFDAWYLIVWQVALYLTLGESVAAYGGAMALAALVGAAAGLVLGRHVDAGHGRRAVLVACAAAALVVGLRSASFSLPWQAVGAHALGAVAMSLMSPVIGATAYNLAKASPCTLRFHLATEAGWDVGCGAACLLAAALAAAQVPLAWTLLLALPALAVEMGVMRRFFADGFAERS